MRLIMFGAFCLLMSSCAKEFLNPYDPATPPDSWMPRDFVLDTLDNNSVRLSWQQEELHIDGYTVRRDISGDLREFILPFDSLRFSDVNVMDSTVTDTCLEVAYSVMARAAENRSDVLTSPLVIFPILTEADAGEDRIFTDNNTQITLTANSPGNWEMGEWAVVSGNGGSFTNSSSPTTGFIGQMCTDYKLRWTISGSCGTESVDEINVSYQQVTQANAGQDIVTTSVAINMSANSPAVSESGQWSIVAGTGGSFSNPSASNTTFTGVLGETYVLRWQITGVCSSSTDEVTVVITPAVGDTYEGGIVFYLDGNGGGLIAAPTDQSTQAHWGCYGNDQNGDDDTTVPELSGVGSGLVNTTYIVNNCAQSGTAARICNDLILDGYSDWFLPSKDELQLMYQNLHTQGLGSFQLAGYWSSTEFSAGDSWKFRFQLGDVDNSNKGYYHHVRAIRSF